ncbi:lectin [Aeromonas jandaei]|uniref:RICIN domain-containing protein n=1 Tax=Aeromonas jandaei TaxID=650 RepID=UPI000A6E8218|nr:lectin [Aeromonas jandaei]UCA32783.1 lectin [Aeromonas jandaei]
MIRPSPLIAACLSLSLGGCQNLDSSDLLLGTVVIGAIGAAAYYGHKQEKKEARAREDHGGQIVAANGKCLDIAGGVRNGNRLQLWDCHDGDNQRFRLDGNAIRVGDKCLDVADGGRDAGAKVIAWDCHGGDNQQWRWERDRLISRSSKLCLDVAQRGSANGTSLILWQCHGGDNQRFRRK